MNVEIVREQETNRMKHAERIGKMQNRKVQDRKDHGSD